MPHKIIGAEYCPYCLKVKNYFEGKNIPFEWVDTETPEGSTIRQAESQKYNHNTIPMVFVDDKFVGGCDAFFAKNGKEFNL